MDNKKIISILFGTRCNLNCKYCLEQTWPKQDYAFNPYIIDYLIKTYGGASPKAVSVWFNGGEPLLYWDSIKYCLERFKECTFDKVIVTNGTLLTNEIVDTLNKYDVEVHISHDGELTKKYRGVDVFESKLNIVKSIHRLVISSVVTKDTTIKDIEQYIYNIFGHKVRIVFNSFKKNSCNEDYVDDDSAENFVNDFYDYCYRNNVTAINDSKIGMKLCSDGYYRNPVTGNKVAYIDKESLNFKLLSLNFSKEESLSKCLFKDCEYYNYCKYPRLQSEEHEYCRKIAKAIEEQHLDPFKAVERVTVYLGNKCNNNCVYCRDYLLNYYRPEANEDNILSIIDFLHQFRHLKQITFVGGEPLLYLDYIKKIVLSVLDKEYSIITNGILLKDQSILRYLLDNNFSVCLSHDGVNNSLTRGSMNSDILDIVKVFNRRNKLSIASVISKDTCDIVANARYFINRFGEYFNWRLMYAQGETNSALIPSSVIDSVYSFLNMYKYSRLSAHVLYKEMRRFIPIPKIKYLFVDLNGNIGYDPLDTIHQFSKQNYITYVAKMRNSSFPKCKDCCINNVCIRNPSGCNSFLIQLRQQTTNVLERIMKESGYYDYTAFVRFLERYL